MKILLYLSAIFFLQTVIYSQNVNDPFIRGVDLSFTPQIESLGGKYKLNGIEKDALDIFKENGVNFVRLRLWNNPKDGYCGLSKTLPYLKRIKAKGLKLLLDFHYSDWWADPGKQNKPTAWANLTFDQLKDSVYSFTYNVISAMKEQGTLPDMVQVGNEITGGMLWPDGRVSGTYNTPENWNKFAQLLKAGIQGVKDASTGADVKIVIHIDRGGDNSGSRWFFDNLINGQGVNFDIIGLSYYPWWHGSLTAVKDNLNDLATRYNKQIIIAETAYPWTTQYLNDGMGNVGFDAAKLPAGYPVSIKGQKDFLIYLSKLVKETANSKGAGFFYWEPAYISVPPIGSSWECFTTFDFQGNAFNSLIAFQNLDSLKSYNVKVRVNTATLGDTIKTNGFLQIRGEVQGISSSLLPSGEQVNWDAASQLIMKNTGGDYWEYQFKMYPLDQLQFKLWAGHTKTKAIYRNLGWEGPVTAYDSTVNYRLFTQGFKDTTLNIQYFNSTGDNFSQYWTPFQPKADYIGVLFRVNLADLIKNNLFDPSGAFTAAVRGDSLNSAGVLSWFENKVLLKREEQSLGGTFYSVTVYFPKMKISEGTQIKYKFFIAGSTFGDWESGIMDRTFSFPKTDTTLMWRFFNDRKILTGVNFKESVQPESYKLFQNYPNPFNPETNLRYSLPERSFIRINVYDQLGRKIRTLYDGYSEKGSFGIKWNSKDDNGTVVSSGIYIIKFNSEKYSSAIKALLLK